jgi:hypothetical protein
MCIKHSLLTMSGLPGAFGLTLLSVGLVLLLAPYLGGTDLNVIVIPRFDPKIARRLKWCSPAFLFLVVLLHAPLWPLVCPKSCVSVSGNLTSTEADLYLTNSSNRSIRLSWRDPDGKEDPMRTFVLESHAPVLSEKTFLGHDWCVVDAATNEYIEEFQITKTEQRIEIR